ncbi:MAG TPA: DUF1566 domain-containing protein, partial [Candidatus Margulisiibacteriota bacterium]|nr:DUF1566 domain-containing protein [Candidatus Margulisiibacteriota bacterium]
KPVAKCKGVSKGLFDTNDWRLLSLTFNSGVANQVVVCARLGFFSGTTTGTAWFDDLRLVALPGQPVGPLPTFTFTPTVTPTSTNAPPPVATFTFTRTPTITLTPTVTGTLPPGAPTYTITPTATKTPTATNTPSNTPTITPTATPTATGTNTPTPDLVGCCQLPNTGICVDSFGGIGPAYCAANNGTWMPQQHCGCGENCTGSCGPPPPPPTLTQTPTFTPDPRFHDNGDGTISDLQTGLMWEKKDRAGGLHDAYNYYPWAGVCSDSSLCQPNSAAATACSAATGAAVGCSQCATGTCNTGVGTIWDWLVQLNGSNFAGHSDWRIPTVGLDGGASQLETILSTGYPNCTTSPCVSPAFNTGCTAGCTVTGCSCTASSFYWSATTYAAGPQSAWYVSFSLGLLSSPPKTAFFSVRAVR